MTPWCLKRRRRWREMRGGELPDATNNQQRRDHHNRGFGARRGRVCLFARRLVVPRRQNVRSAPAVKDRKARREEKKKTDVAMPESAVASDGAIVGPLLAEDMAWKKDDTADLVYEAVHAGFRFVDTACQPRHYDEAGVGHGWKTAAGEMGLKRKDVFLQMKLTAPDGQDRNNMPCEGADDNQLKDEAARAHDEAGRGRGHSTTDDG
ncbi:hypothetical protein ACHAW5_003909 [Stephanodiscus triporus]|uniref:NADP-dependent oxidoreductase domain-containing protein n=1 Tax=Stephanodiscus triporus TaxID=2934178 RepID=A0ABD3MNQ7_9STRA